MEILIGEFWINTLWVTGAVVLVLLLLTSWVTNVLGIPGNWINLALIGLWMFLARDTEVMGYTWIALIAMIVVAVLGEIIEFAAGALGTSAVGGSKRSGVLSLVGSMIGGVVGMFVGLPIPIPIIASVISALLFACGGALAGAALGEYWAEGKWDTSLKVGHAAFWARLIGTVAKTFCGAVIVAVATIGLFVSWL